VARGSISRVRLIAFGLALASAAVPFRGEAKVTRYAVLADLQQAGSHVLIRSGDAAPYGKASLDGRRLEIKCLAVSGQLGVTYLLTPYLEEGVVVLRGSLKSGQLLWITILKHPLRKPQMSIRTTPGENWGWCGTGGASFYEATRASGYVIITT
jgi:hypothetical protein